MDPKSDLLGVVDMRCDLEDDADILVLKTVVPAAFLGVQAGGDEGHLSPDEQLAEFVV